jgi:hypothetical protein
MEPAAWSSGIFFPQIYLDPFGTTDVPPGPTLAGVAEV